MSGKIFNKIVILLCALLLSALFLCGCGSSGKNIKTNEGSFEFDNGDTPISDDIPSSWNTPSGGEITDDDERDEMPPQHEIKAIKLSFELCNEGKSYCLIEATGNSEKKICVPTIYDGLPVEEIGERAFDKCDEITEIEFSDSIKYIGRDAFAGCDKLTALHFNGDISDWNAIEHVTPPLLNAKNLYLNGVLLTGKLMLPSDLEAVSDNAFAGCSGITEVEANGSDIVIGNNSFGSCSDITKISLSGSVRVGDAAFSSCNALESVKITGTMPTISISAFSYDSIRNAEIDFSYIQAIPKSGLRSLTITGGKSIPSYFFSNTSGYNSLDEVEIKNVDTIGEYAFSKNKSLKKVKLGSGVRQIDRFAFADCTALSDVSFSFTITIMNDAAFIRCSALASITLPSELTTIPAYCFSGCKLLSNITFTKSITVFSANSFINCASTMNFYFDGTIAQWNKIRKWANWISYGTTHIAHCSDGDIRGNG